MFFFIDRKGRREKVWSVTIITPVRKSILNNGVLKNILQIEKIE